MIIRINTVAAASDIVAAFKVFLCKRNFFNCKFGQINFFAERGDKVFRLKVGNILKYTELSFNGSFNIFRCLAACTDRADINILIIEM